MFFKTKLSVSLFLLALASGCNAQTAPATTAATPPVSIGETGDRHPDLNCIYPAEAFFHLNKGGTLLDITKAPFNAKGDGVTDDTAAFVRAYDFVLREQDKIGYSSAAMLNDNPKNFAPNEEGYPSDGPVKSNDSSFIIYIPNGNYLVSDTIIYSMADRTPSKRNAIFLRDDGTPMEKSTGWERVIWIRFIGQNRDKTIIRLKDNAEGFGAGSEKAVIAYGKSPFNNRKAMNVLRNLTIDTGKGNAGAVAVDFTGANKAQIANVTLRSGDGAGYCGLQMKRPPVIGYHYDISVEGFDYGIVSSVGHATAPVFEWVTLKNQNKAGVFLEKQGKDAQGHGQAMIAMRKFKSENRAPAALLDVDGGHLVLLDSELIGLDAAQPAIDLKQGQLFLSNVSARGESVLVAAHGNGPDVKTGNVQLYASGATVLADEAAPLKRMEVREAPVAQWPLGADEWATPAQFGAKGDGVTDDTAAIQAALDSGKPFIFLTQGQHATSAVLKVPASVRSINGMFRFNRDVDFQVDQSSETPLRLTDIFRSEIKVNARRSIVLDHFESEYSNTPKAAGSTLYLLNGSYPGAKKNPAKVDIFAWSMNNEGKGLPITNDGARAWVLGLKTERGPALKLINGARMEIYGATVGVRPDSPTFVVDDSQLILVANSSAGDWDADKIAIQELLVGGKIRQVKAGELPTRETAKAGKAGEADTLRIIPFYATQSK